jgi:hypothetical protein
MQLSELTDDQFFEALKRRFVQWGVIQAPRQSPMPGGTGRLVTDGEPPPVTHKVRTGRRADELLNMSPEDRAKYRAPSLTILKAIVDEEVDKPEDGRQLFEPRG